MKCYPSFLGLNSSFRSLVRQKCFLSHTCTYDTFSRSFTLKIVYFLAKRLLLMAENYLSMSVCSHRFWQWFSSSENFTFIKYNQFARLPIFEDGFTNLKSHLDIAFKRLCIIHQITQKDFLLQDTGWYWTTPLIVIFLCLVEEFILKMFNWRRNAA